MIDLEAIQKRYWDWYCPPDRNCCPRNGDFSLRDKGETTFRTWRACWQKSSDAIRTC